MTWNYLHEINRQIAMLAPVLSKLSSTGIFFTEPAPVAGLPLLPGALVESVTSNTPMMVGEFTGQNGERYAMLVNLSLERSANFQFRTRITDGVMDEVSAVDGQLREYKAGKDGFWLTGGEGVLVKF